MAEKLCPYAKKVRKFTALVCEKRIGTDDINKKTVAELANAMCKHQFYCPMSGNWENSVQSRKCPIRSENAI